MTVEYSAHILMRLKLRGLDRDMPERIFREAAQRYLDTGTGHLIAVKREVIYGSERDVMVAYRKDVERVILLTIHPLKDGQVKNRLESGRWRAI